MLPWGCGPWGCKELDMTERLNNNMPKHMLLLSACGSDHIIFDHMYNLTLLLYFYSIYLICTFFFFAVPCSMWDLPDQELNLCPLNHLELDMEQQTGSK